MVAIVRLNAEDEDSYFLMMLATQINLLDDKNSGGHNALRYCYR